MQKNTCTVVTIGVRFKIKIKEIRAFRPIPSLIMLHVHSQVQNLIGFVLNTSSPKPLKCNLKQGRGGLLCERGECLEDSSFCKSKNNIFCSDGFRCSNCLHFNIFIKIE